MGWIAFLETDTGDVLRIVHHDGLAGGKALLSFLTTAESSCSKGNRIEEDDFLWISDFNKNSGINFCETIEKLTHVYYSGDWNYQDDKYDLFINRFPNAEISKAEFIRTIKEIQEMWADIQSLIKDVELLINEFQKGYLKETDWYLEQDTINDFEGLLNALNLAKERNAKEVRIRIV